MVKAQTPVLLLLVGLPASGKSTLARKIAGRFGLPVLEKDDIKEELFDTVGYRNYPEKRRLDVAANAVLLRAAGNLLDAGTSIILVNNFRKDMEEGVQRFLDAHPCRPVLLFLDCDADGCYQRYIARDIAQARHLGHTLPDHYPLNPGEVPHDNIPTRERYKEIFEDLGMAEFSVNCPKITVTVKDPDDIDYPRLYQTLEEKFRFSGEE